MQCRCSMSSRTGVVATTILRWVVGATFLFSGLTKCVDPVGSAIYVEKYLATYSLETFLPLSEGIAVTLAVVETLLGVLLVTGVLRHITSLISLLILSLFTVVTLLSATVLPIGECGCFGGILKLTPWQTFLKNIVLLVLCYLLWRCRGEKRPIVPKNGIAVIVGIVVPLGVSLYALRHLPLVDTMPYRVETALYDAVAMERDKEEQAVCNVLIFKNIKTGESVEFDASDGVCWEDDDLEFVEAVTRRMSVETTYDDFRLYDSEGEDRTLDVIGRKGRVALLCINDTKDISARHLRGINSLLTQYPLRAIVVLTAVDISDIEDVISVSDVEMYAVDAMILRSVIRSDIGVVILRDGVVEFKSDIRDI